MHRRSPPKHRHDGTSPLPLGLDWSQPPRKWERRLKSFFTQLLERIFLTESFRQNGRETIWPHDPQHGWSYCVTIPSWVILPKSRGSDPIVFYRVQVGLQSPEGVAITRGVLRRFNDFLNLYSNLKKSFPKKAIPSTPPKGLLRIKSQALLEERRCSLEEWMTKLLSDIDVSRSVSVASFLDLEAAARSLFQEVSEHTLATNSVQESSSSSLPAILGSASIMSDYGSDTAYEISELGTPTLRRDENSEVGMEDLSLDEDLTVPIENLVKYSMSNIDEGLFMGQTILEKLEGLPRSKAHTSHGNNIRNKDLSNGNASKASSLAGSTREVLSEPEHSKVIGHVREFSNESIGSNISSLRGSEISHLGIPHSSAEVYFDHPGGTERSSSMEIFCDSELHTSGGGTQLVIPSDQHHKMNRVLFTMQRRLVTAKADTEDLIARLNQEIAVKDYLATKVKDLEVELETAQEKGREKLQQALLIERDRFTQMQWDMEELRRKSLEMELKLKAKSEQDQKSSHPESTENSSVLEKDKLMQDLDSYREQLDNVLKQYGELEAKSKTDRKVLVKEVKSLRSSQIQLEHELNKLLKEKSEVEKLLEQERQRSKQAETAIEQLLNESKFVLDQLQECSLKFPVVDGDGFNTYSSSVANAMDLLTISDGQIGIILRKAELLSQDDKAAASDTNDHGMVDDRMTMYEELRKVLAGIFVDSSRLRKQVNSVIRHTLRKDSNNFAEGIQ